MTAVSLRELIEHGTLGGARVGMSRSEVETCLGPPPDWSARQAVGSAEIWRYGAFEIHFQRELAWMLFCDEPSELEAWSADPTGSETMDILGRRQVVTGGGATLTFDIEHGLERLVAIAVRAR